MLASSQGCLARKNFSGRLRKLLFGHAAPKRLSSSLAPPESAFAVRLPVPCSQSQQSQTPGTGSKTRCCGTGVLHLQLVIDLELAFLLGFARLSTLSISLWGIGDSAQCCNTCTPFRAAEAWGSLAALFSDTRVLVCTHCQVKSSQEHENEKKA